jgi:hypothetical protein
VDARTEMQKTVRCGAADGASDDGQAEETRAEVLAAPTAVRESRGRAGRGKVERELEIVGGCSSGSRSLTHSVLLFLP